MIHKIEFNTQSEDFDRFEYRATLDGEKLASTLNAVAEKIRDWVKWDERNEINKDEIHEEFYEILRDRGVDLEYYGY